MANIAAEERCEKRVADELAKLSALEGVSGKEASKQRSAIKSRLQTARKHLCVFQPWLDDFALEQDAPVAEIDTAPPSYVPAHEGFDVQLILNRVCSIPQEWREAYLSSRFTDEAGVGEFMNIDLMGGSFPVVQSRYDNRLPGRDRAETKLENNGHVVAGSHALDAFNSAMFDLIEPAYRKLETFANFPGCASTNQNNLSRQSSQALRWILAFMRARNTSIVNRNLTRSALEEMVGAMRAATMISTSAFERGTAEAMYEQFMSRMKASECFPRYAMIINEERTAFTVLENDALDPMIDWEGCSKQGVRFGVKCFNKQTQVENFPLPKPRVRTILDHIEMIKRFRVERKQQSSRKQAA